MIKNIAKVAVAAAALGGMQLVAAVPAHAQAEGILCGFVSITDPTGEGDVQTGEVDGGPLTATSTDPNAPSADPTASLTLTCTIQVGATGATYAGPDAASASASGTGAVVLAPTQISYVSPAGSNVYLCTTITVNGVTYYYDYTNGTWSTSSSVDCALAISQEVDPAPDPVEEAIDDVFEAIDPIEQIIDDNACGALALVFPPDGDIPGIWDCPPYGN